MLFTEHVLEDWASANAFAHGQRLYWSNQVVHVSVHAARNGSLNVTGSVDRREPKRVRLIISPDHQRVETFHCTCGEDRPGMCAHEVALGFAAMHQTDPALSRAALPLTKEETNRTEGVGARLPSRFRPFTLDRIQLEASYDRERDEVTVLATSVYGPHMFSLLESTAVTPDPSGRAIERDWVAEQEAVARCTRHFGPPVSFLEMRFVVPASGLYQLLTVGFPDLMEAFDVRVDDTLQPLLDVERETIGSEWKFAQETQQDWFDFSVEWHCGKTQVSFDELRQMVSSQQPYIRRADGTFVVCANRDEVKTWLSTMDETEHVGAGTYRSRLRLAPAILELIRGSRSAHLAAMNETFERFLQEVQTGRLQEPIEWPTHLTSVMREYQKDGVAWMLFLQRYGFGGVLADDMGLGKTLQVLGLLSLTRDRLQGTSLVVCPKTLTMTWFNEVKKFTPELSVVILDGTRAERQQIFETLDSYDVVITPYSALARDILWYVGRRDRPFVYCVLDEAQYVKNARTLTAQAVRAVSAKLCLAVTGTPLENRVREVWSIFDFLMPGFLSDAQTFRTRFERPIEERSSTDVLMDLQRRLRPFVLRRTKESHLKGLPPKIEQTSIATLTPEQLVVYARTLAEVRQEVAAAVERRGFARARVEILSALMKLRRITDHPALVDRRLPRTEALSGKMALAIELVQEAVSGGHKVLLFSQFTSMLDILREALDRLEIGHVTIEGKTRDRQTQIDTFLTDPKAQVFLLSLKAGGTGLTLTAADTVILYDPWWNPQVERQAMDRAHRIGQERTVNVYKLITQNTVEEKVVALQTRKRQLFDALMSEQTERLADLTWEDVRDILG